MSKSAHFTKNILYVNSSAVLFGAETRLLDIIRNLDKTKFQPFVLLPKTGPLDEKLKELGVVTMYLDYQFHITFHPLKKFFRLTGDFIRFARQHQIDIIHVNLHIKCSNFWLAFLILGKPVIVHMRSHFWINIFEKFVICLTAKVICISKAVEQAFLEKRRSSFFMLHRPGHTEIIYDGIDVDQFSPKPSSGRIRRELGVESRDFLVALIGAVDRLKGQDIFVEAAKIVLQKHQYVKFVIAGDLYATNPKNNDYRERLVRRISELMLTDRFVLTGFRNDVDLFMNEIDLLVQPSEREALGTSMIEAMSCAKPVIGTNVDGIPEVIGDNEGGMLLETRTAEALAKAIIFFIERPAETRLRGLQGRARVLTNFNIFNNIKRIEEIYFEALGHR